MTLGSLILVAAAAGAAPSGQARDSSHWAPVNIPLAHVRVQIPCNDADIAAFSKSHTAPAGIVACERPEYIAHVMYLVNTKPEFFDDFAANDQKVATEHSSGQSGHHRFYKSRELNEDKDEVTQLIELRSTSSLMLLLRSKVAPSEKFFDLAHRFFGSLERTDQ